MELHALLSHPVSKRIWNRVYHVWAEDVPHTQSRMWNTIAQCHYLTTFTVYITDDYKRWQLSYQSSGSVNKINYSLFLFGHHRDVAVSDDQPKSRPLREWSLRVHLRLSSGWVPANSRLYEKARVSTEYSANITLNHEALRLADSKLCF